MSNARWLSYILNKCIMKLKQITSHKIVRIYDFNKDRHNSTKGSWTCKKSIVYCLTFCSLLFFFYYLKTLISDIITDIDKEGVAV